MDQFLGSKGSARRSVVLAAGLAIVGFLGTKLLLPGAGHPATGTPNGVYFQGVVFGALQALTAMGIVLIYRTSRIVNFAQAALGAAGAIFAYNVIVVYHLPYLLAFLIGVIVSAIIGTFCDLFLRKFFNAPRLVVTIITIGLAGVLAGAPGAVSGLPIWGDARTLQNLVGATPVHPLPKFKLLWFGPVFPVTFAHLLAIGVVLAALVGISAFFRFTRMGIAVRASAENADRAELLGINVRILSTVVWTMAGALSGAGVILFGTLSTFAIGAQGAPIVLIVALAAAVLARMRSLPMAAFAAVGLTTLQQTLQWSYPNFADIIVAGFFAVILVGLILQRRALGRLEEVSSWEATNEIRPTPRELLAVPGVRNWRYILIGLVIAGVLAFPWIVSTGTTNTGGVVAISGIVILSLVVLTGWAGQMSLGQWGFVAVGAVAGGLLTGKLHLPFWLALPIGGTITSAFAVVVGLPALRIKGLFLGVTTFAFSFAARAVLFNDRIARVLIPDKVARPNLILFDFEDERSMYYLSLVVLILCVLAVSALRRSRTGRVLIALRENEAELQAFGVNAVRAKLTAFALAGFLAGIAGVLFAAHQRSVTPTSYEPIESLNIFVYAVIGGIGSIPGAMFGAVFRALTTLLPTDPILGFFINTSTGLLVILYVLPGGLSSLAFSMIRDGIYRIVAQRRQMIVPSLFADLDPEALRQRLVPLGPPGEGFGLEALSHTQRYRLESELYGLHEGASGSSHAPDDKAALGAAAESLAAASEG